MIAKFPECVKFQNSAGCTILYSAAIEGNINLVKALVDGGSDVHAANEQGLTALHYAAYNGHTAVAQFLIEKGADVHAQNEQGLTALHYAAQNGHIPVAKVLIEHKADVNVVNERGLTALYLAAVNGGFDKIFTTDILKQCSSINISHLKIKDNILQILHDVITTSPNLTKLELGDQSLATVKSLGININDNIIECTSSIPEVACFVEGLCSANIMTAKHLDSQGSDLKTVDPELNTETMIVPMEDAEFVGLLGGG